jgi:hypothetical protein
VSSPPLDPPIYRPFARLAYGALLALGTPLGLWVAGGRVTASLVWLHAGVQLFVFFATLIVGVAQHLLPRFTGRPVRASRLAPWMLGALVGALILRVVGAAWPPAAIAGAALHAAAFGTFAGWVWRALGDTPLHLLRVQLTLASAWLGAAAALEASLRGVGGGVPSAAGMHVVYAMALHGGVLGWVLGVLLRAGPMFVRDWAVPGLLARATPWALAVSVALAALGAGGLVGAARLADLLALGTVAAALVGAGALHRARGGLPMLSRSAPEARIFRVAVGSAVGGAALSLVALVLGAAAPRSLTDAIRHLLAIGVIGAVVIAMTFRLVPVLEGRPLPWPALRAVALWSLTAAVLVRTAQGWLPAGAREVAGVLAFVAFACPAVALVPGVSGASGRASTADRT